MRKWPVGTLARWWVWLLAGATVPQCGLGRRLGCLATPCGLQLEGTEGVEEPVEFLRVHVVACRACLAVPALEKEDVLGYSGGDGGREASLASRDPGEARHVGATSAQGPSKRVSKHEDRYRAGGGGGGAARYVSRRKKSGRQCGQRAAGLARFLPSAEMASPFWASLTCSWKTRSRRGLRERPMAGRRPCARSHSFGGPCGPQLDHRSRGCRNQCGTRTKCRRP